MALLLGTTPLPAAALQRQWADRHLVPRQTSAAAQTSAAEPLSMALANGGTVQREHTCLVDSTSSCPGLVEINRRSWRLGLPPSANLLLYGPSFMSEIVSSIIAPNADELVRSRLVEVFVYKLPTLRAAALLAASQLSGKRGMDGW